MYASTVEDQTLTFQVSGMLWQRSLVMRDLETETLWSHLLGRAMRGDLEGSQLETLPSSMTTWKDWKTRHPETDVLAMSRTTKRYREQAWRNPERFVFGLLPGIDAPARAVSLSRLQEEGVVAVELDDRAHLVTHTSAGGSIQSFVAAVDGEPLTFTAEGSDRMKDEETGSNWDRASGACLSGPHQGRSLEEIAGTISFREAWEMFHPDGRILD